MFVHDTFECRVCGSLFLEASGEGLTVDELGSSY